MLLDALGREGLRSVRATCGIGVCGACTVLLDGEPVSGCLTLDRAGGGARADDRRGAGRQSDPVQRAFAEAHAFQCGWCTPGFVLDRAGARGGAPGPTTPRSPRRSAATSAAAAAT